ncbi:MAG TPA: MFS transporter [Chloroflexota bacterium]|nr:MFS transporter [Chloroflexota bacterium]
MIRALAAPTLSLRPLAAAEVSASAAGRLDLATKVLYGAGEIANSSKTVLFGLFLLFFYTTVMGLPGTLVGLATAAGLLWDALIDPYIGHLSDRTRSAFGRRHGFMLAGALAVGPTFWALFSPPAGLSTGALFAWLLVTGLLVRLAHSLFVVPYHALGAELSRDYHERTSITGIRGACALAGTVATAGLSFVLFFPNTIPGQDPKLSYAGYPAMGFWLGLAMSAAALTATLSTARRAAQARPLVPASVPRETRESSGLIGDVVISLRNPPFRALACAFALMFLGTVVNGALTVHFLTYYARIPESVALSALQAAFYGGALAGVVVWLRVARVVEKRALFALAGVATAGLMLGATALFGEGRLFGAGATQPLLAGQALAGFFGSLFWILPHSMLADVADADALVTGRRREGTFFGILSLAQQLATGLSILLTGVLLDRFAGLAAGQSHQAPETVARIGLLFGALPAALLLGGALLIAGYRLDRRRVIAIQERLADQRRSSWLVS